jgi:predicted N-acyltransferase
VVGAVAAFVKDHSYGEYIFDWGWANAAQRAGLPYYPKLVIAAPATPATGTRILLARDAPPGTADALIAAVRNVADETGCS